MLGGTVRNPGVAWWISLCLHAAVLLAVANVSFELVYGTAVVTLFPTERVRDAKLLPTDFSSQVAPSDAIGGGDGMYGADLGAAPSLAELATFPSLETDRRDSSFELQASEVSLMEAPRLDVNQVIRGVAAVGATGAQGAIDQITDELLQMLNDGPTLVVWILDRSASLAPQRALIVQRLRRIYEELGVIEASGHRAFQRDTIAPLLTAVMSFAEQPTWIIKKPTDDLAAIQSAIASVGDDLNGTGIERTFTALAQAATHFKSLRRPDRSTGLPQRNVALVVFSDEAGDDAEGLDHTVQLCRQFSMPVYVVGVPAPFGRQFTPVKWIDPDPAYDQRPQWPTVRQGPETLFPEYVKLQFTGEAPDAPALDSGFGPYALTRLCYESGGIYFAVHPNRRVGRTVGRYEVAPYTAFLEAFFDPEIMRRYRPDYVSSAEYQRRVADSVLRQSLVEAARQSWVAPLSDPGVIFVRRDEATLVAALTAAQRDAAKLQPFVENLYAILERGVAARAAESVPRWQAGFDLAWGRVAAELTRTAGYNSMLAQAKRGMPFSQPRNNTWVLQASDSIEAGSRLQEIGQQARETLEQVVQSHAGTPWALLAQRELERPLGWKWTESYTELEPDREPTDNGDDPRPPRDEQRLLLERLPRRNPPQL